MKLYAILHNSEYNDVEFAPVEECMTFATLTNEEDANYFVEIFGDLEFKVQEIDTDEIMDIIAKKREGLEFYRVTLSHNELDIRRVDLNTIMHQRATTDMIRGSYAESLAFVWAKSYNDASQQVYDKLVEHQKSTHEAYELMMRPPEPEVIEEVEPEKEETASDYSKGKEEA